MRLNLSNRLALLAVSALIGFPEVGSAQGPGPAETTGRLQPDVTSAEGAEFLLLPVGARSAGMGGAVTASRGSGEAVMWSPAGLAALRDGRVMFNHSETAFDTRADVVSLLVPAKPVGTVGVTYYLVDFGEFQNTTADGTVQGTISFRNQEFLVSFATELIGPLEAGVNYKLIQLIFRCDGLCPGVASFTRSTHAIDVGVIYDRPVGLPLAVGGSIRHLGFPLEGVNEDDPLPTRIRLGMTYEALSTFTTDSTFALALAVDVEQRWRDPGDPDVMVGSEFGVADRVFLRAGYAFHQSGRGGAALGLGLTQDWFHVDLSRGFNSLDAASDSESLQVNFGLIF